MISSFSLLLGGGSALSFGLEVPEAPLKRTVERLLEPGAEEAGDEPVIGLLRPHNRRVLASLEGIDVHRFEAKGLAAPGDPPGRFDVLKRRRDRPGTRPPTKLRSFGEGSV